MLINLLCAITTISYAEDLVEASLEKLGRDGVTKKLVARRKREENKRRKEEQAALARQRMTAGNSANAGNGTAAAASAGNASGGGEDSKEIKKLRSSLLRMAKKSMGFERSGAPSNWRFEVPGTSGATFAALMGRPGDVGLDTFVKNGAYYAERCGPMRLFGLKEESQLEKQFKCEMVGQRIGDQVVVRYKESTMELSVSGYAEICDGGFSFAGW